MSFRKRKREDEPKFYAVHVGSKPGVYYTWNDCKSQIDKYKGALYKKFGTLTEAEDFVANGLTRNSGKFYAVRNGRVPGIYTDWPTANAQIVGWTKPSYRSFLTRAEAEVFLRAQDPSNISAPAEPSSHDSNNNNTADTPTSSSKKQKKSSTPTDRPNELTLGPDDDPAPAGEGPHPPMTEDTFDSAITLDPSTGRIRYKTPAEYHRQKMTPTAKRDAMLNVYTDGSALGNGRDAAVAGVGVYFGPADGRNVSEALPGTRQTNQRAELTAVQRALELAPRARDVTIHTDSNYAIKCVTEWFQRWRDNGWKSSTGKPVENRDVIEAVLGRIEQRQGAGGRTLFRWVKGHSGEEGNVRADELAVEGAMAARRWNEMGGAAESVRGSAGAGRSNS